jgi:hypothetical protein
MRRLVLKKLNNFNINKGKTMKKLLISTALVSSVLTGVAFSQTTITGEMRLGYKTHYDGLENSDSARGFGNEQQINIQNKGKTNFGWDYASGFSIEVDNNSAASAFDENVFIDFINPSSGTTLSISRDHIQRSDSARNASVAFGYDAPDVMDGAVNASDASFLLIRATPGTNAGQSFGIAIIQEVAKLGKVSYSYIPNTVEAGSSEGMGAAGESAYEIGFTGSLGVAGLNTYAFEGKKEKADTTAGIAGKKPQQRNFGISYNTGPITVGYEYTKHVGFNAALGFDDTNEIKEQGFGIAYAVNKELSLQLHHTKASQDQNGSSEVSTEDAKITSIQAGYNLGPVALIVGAGKYDGIGGGENEDGKTIFTRLLTAF